MRAFYDRTNQVTAEGLELIRDKYEHMLIQQNRLAGNAAYLPLSLFRRESIYKTYTEVFPAAPDYLRYSPGEMQSLIVCLLVRTDVLDGVDRFLVQDNICVNFAYIKHRRIRNGFIGPDGRPLE